MLTDLFRGNARLINFINTTTAKNGACPHFFIYVLTNDILLCIVCIRESNTKNTNDTHTTLGGILMNNNISKKQITIYLTVAFVLAYLLQIIGSIINNKETQTGILIFQGCLALAMFAPAPLAKFTIPQESSYLLGAFAVSRASL